MNHFSNHVPKRAKLLRAHCSRKADLIHYIRKTIYIRRSTAGGEIKVNGQQRKLMIIITYIHGSVTAVKNTTCEIILQSQVFFQRSPLVIILKDGTNKCSASESEWQLKYSGAYASDVPYHATWAQLPFHWQFQCILTKSHVECLSLLPTFCSSLS